MAPGGGDAIGSLPFAGQPPGGALAQQAMPSIVLEGPDLAAIQALVIDAWGDGYAELFNLGIGGWVRVELQGSVSLVLDRNQLASSPVRYGLDVSQGFSGGLGVLTQNQHILRTQILPATGDLSLPLPLLASSGVIDQGALTMHSFNALQRHHRLEISGSGGTVRLDSRQ